MKKLLFFIMFFPILSFANGKTDNGIRLNQVGMYPGQEKIAVIENGKYGEPFKIISDNGDVVFEGRTSRVATSPWSGKQRAIADFSSFDKRGSYKFVCGNDTAAFIINDHALDKIATGLLHAYYILRSGIPIEEQYAGIYKRELGHLDTHVLVHESAATKTRPTGTVIPSPFGWYDAGDYNKYIVNSAFTIGQILIVYEVNKDFFVKQHLDIPEKDNSTPDVLDEMMFNLKWMLTMQDPADGGVYHKLTTPDFESTVMPVDCHQTRYVVEKTTAATLDFAAVMALASRIFEGNTDYPDFSSKAADAAKKAWTWAIANPQVYYDQAEMNKQFKPEINTGAYDDTNVEDEFFWAATELYLLTNEKEYLSKAHEYAPENFVSPVWGNVAGLARYEWAISNDGDCLVEESRKQIVDYSNGKGSSVFTSCFQTPSGNVASDFCWASLAENFATPGITFLFAYHLTGDKRYITMAQENADYILGRNATGYCFITGYGQKSPLNPHHRISSADGIDAPVPGLLVGGPNASQQDKEYINFWGGYPSDYPDESYVDSKFSYASNEIAINWNASAVGLFSWLVTLQD